MVDYRRQFIGIFRGKEGTRQKDPEVCFTLDFIGFYGDFDGCLAGTRTPTSRIRICGATITPRGKRPIFSDWRGRRGSNPQPPDRQSSALTNCATTPLLRKVIDSISYSPRTAQGGILSFFRRYAIAARAAARSANSPPAIIWTIRLPMAVPSTGPAKTSSPVASAVSAFRYLS